MIMCRQNMYFDALSSAEVVLQRMRVINKTLMQTPLTGDPLSPECRSVVAAALMEYQITSEEVISFPVGYDPKQYNFGFLREAVSKRKP